MPVNIPPQPEKSVRIILVLERRAERLDSLLLEAIRQQQENAKLRGISRSGLKELFNKHKVQIKGQPARPSSSLATGTTYVDILFS
ncbi:MAG: hypothetical protein U1F27_00890 [Turneriella sp.]